MEQNDKNINDNQNDKPQNGSKSVYIYNNSTFHDNVFYNLSKKSERIITAIHMVSNFIPKTEPLRHDLRKHSLIIIKELNKCISCDAYDKQFFLEESLVAVEYIITLLSVAETLGLVSIMNKNLLEKSLYNLGRQIDYHLQHAIKYEHNFSELHNAGEIDKDTLLNFLQDNVQFSDILSGKFEKALNDRLINKTTFKTTQNDIKNDTKRHVVYKPISTNTHPTPGATKERREKIREIIMLKKDATIKDIATRITDCSEKTLQRDLLELIKDGIIEKEGNKRWSLYHIKKQSQNDI